MVERRVLRYDHAEVMSRRPEACRRGAGRRQAFQHGAHGRRDDRRCRPRRLAKNRFSKATSSSACFNLANSDSTGEGVPILSGHSFHGRRQAASWPPHADAKSRQKRGGGRGRNRSCSILPPILEVVRRQSSIDRGIVEVLVAHESSARSSRKPFFAEVKSYRVAELVGKNLEIEPRNPPRLRNNGLNVTSGHWRTSLTQKDPG